MLLPPLPRLADLLEGQGARIHRDGRLNLWACRNPEGQPNAFDDDFVAFWITEHNPTRWHGWRWTCTTDPGRYWLREPMNVAGTAAIAPGHYADAYKVGRHKGLPALRQCGDLLVYRDADRDDRHAMSGPLLSAGPAAAINIHGTKGHASTRVGKWSAGCIVLPAVKRGDGRDSSPIHELVGIAKATTLRTGQATFDLTLTLGVPHA